MKKQTIITLSLIATAIFIVVVVIILNKESSDSVSTNAKTIDKNLIVGNWLRTDSDYRIQISKINEDGTIEAQYFNPNPINVGKAN
jgi:hypothetical protein